MNCPECGFHETQRLATEEQAAEAQPQKSRIGPRRLLCYGSIENEPGQQDAEQPEHPETI